MSARTVIVTRAVPGPTAAIAMPSARDAASLANIRCATVSASAFGSDLEDARVIEVGSENVQAMRWMESCGDELLVLRPSNDSLLTSPEVRRTLAQECGDPFLIVVRKTQFALQVTLQFEARRQRQQCTGIDRFADAHKRARRPRGQLHRQRVRRRHQLRVVDTLPDQSPLLRLFSRQLLAQQRQAER